MTKKTKKSPLTLHTLLGALSFWGTAARGILFGFVTFIVFIVALSEATSGSAVEAQTMVLIYVLGSFLLLELGYIVIARTYELIKQLDVLCLVLAEMLLGLLYVVPKLVVDPDVTLRVDPLTYVIFVPIVALGIRMLLGILFGKHQR